MNKENVSLKSHADYFLAVSTKLFETLYQECEEEGQVWNLARIGVCMNFSAPMGIQDMAKTVIWQVGEQTISRQDQWLKAINGRVSYIQPCLSPQSMVGLAWTHP